MDAEALSLAVACRYSWFLGGAFQGKVPFTKQVAAGLTTSSFAIAVASPTDLVKVGAPALY
jgi:hypothetical protein